MQFWFGCAVSRVNGLAPAARRAPGYYNTPMPAWYGSVVEGHGQYHAFAAARTVPGGPPMGGYSTNPKLVRLASTIGAAAGPYVLQGAVLPRLAHEARGLQCRTAQR